LSRFEIGKVNSLKLYGNAGNINSGSFLVSASTGPWLFQRLNPAVFDNVERVQANAQQWAEASNVLSLVNPSLGWKEIQFARTPEGEMLVNGWRAIALIGNTVSYRALASAPPDTARQLGRGLAISRAIGRMLVPEEMSPSLLGYRDSELYWRQYQSIVSGDDSEHLPTDPELRKATATMFRRSLENAEFESRLNNPRAQWIAGILKQHLDLVRSVAELITTGELSTTVIHGDTKLDNFLFDEETYDVCALIDLDTVMPHAWVTDFGDTIRSVANPVGEHPARIDKVRFDMRAFRETVRGVFELATECTETEITAMAVAPAVLTWEQSLRFFTDYLRGDTYYGAKTPTQNLDRAEVQACLLTAIRSQQAEMHQCVREYAGI
jgi:hypothetical protein